MIVKNYKLFTESTDTLLMSKPIIGNHMELIKMELLERLNKTNHLSSEDYINADKIDKMMQDLCDIFNVNGINKSSVPNYFFYQKDFDYENNKGIYVFETNEDEDTFIFDLVNEIQGYKL